MLQRDAPRVVERLIGPSCEYTRASRLRLVRCENIPVYPMVVRFPQHVTGFIAQSAWQTEYFKALGYPRSIMLQHPQTNFDDRHNTGERAVTTIGYTGIFSQRTNRRRDARVHSHDGPIRRSHLASRKRRCVTTRARRGHMASVKNGREN
eukprot:1184165-Prorocentrum_minimum.AAC.1